MAKQMDDKRLLTLVDQEFTDSMGTSSSDISHERAENWDYYLSQKFGNEVEGLSEVVTSDVADVVDGIMPSLLRTFTTSDNLVDFDAVGQEDVEGAEQESDYVNHVFFKRNDAFMILYTWFFDALVQKNGVVKAWWDESEEVTTESYEGLTEEELADLLDDEELEAVEREERTAMMPVEIPQLGDFAEAEVTVFDVKFKRTSKMGRLCVEPVPPEEYRKSSDTRSLDPANGRMVGQERQVTRSELLEMGFPKDIVESLPADSGEGSKKDTLEGLARYDKSDEDIHASNDHSQDLITLREAYLKVDYDGDGFSELRQVFSAGNEILSNEEIDRQPFHVICPQPLPHKHFGRATAEKVKDVQKVTSTLTRQILDNLYHTNNPGHAVWEQGIGETTMDDLLTSRVGGVKRFSRPVGESWQPISVPFTAGASYPMLEWWDKTKRDRTGVANDGEGLEPEQLKNIQSSVMAQANDLNRMKVETIVRVFAETGLKSLFRHIHELLLKHQTKPETVRLRGQWVDVDPQQWRHRSDMTVKIGLGIGSREQNLLHLEAIGQKQEKMVEIGGMGTLVTPQNLYNTNAEYVKNANLKTPELFFQNPETAPPKEDEGPSPQEQLAMEQLKLQKREQDVRMQEDMLKHQREMEKLRQSQEEINNNLETKLEELRNALTEMELKYDENVPGSKV